MPRVAPCLACVQARRQGGWQGGHGLLGLEYWRVVRTEEAWDLCVGMLDTCLLVCLCLRHSVRAVLLSCWSGARTVQQPVCLCPNTTDGTRAKCKSGGGFFKQIQKDMT